MRARRRAGDAGVSLVEAVVALAVAATAVAAFYDSLASGALLSRRAETRAEAALAAFLVLDRAGLDLPLIPGAEEAGRLRGLDWRYRVLDASARIEGLALAPGEILLVEVVVAAPGEPYRLAALRYAEDPL